MDALVHKHIAEERGRIADMMQAKLPRELRDEVYSYIIGENDWRSAEDYLDLHLLESTTNRDL